MATPQLPPDDPALKALQHKDEILAALDAMTSGAPAAAPEPAPEIKQEAAQPPLFEDRLAEFRRTFSEAMVDRADIGEATRIAQEATQLIAGELAERERQLQAAKDYFDAQLKDTGEDSQQTQDAAQLVREWQAAVDQVRAEADDTEQFDVGPLIAEQQQAQEQAAPSEVTPVPEQQKVRVEGSVTIEELRAAKERLDTLREELIRISREVEIRIAKAEIGL